MALGNLAPFAHLLGDAAVHDQRMSVARSQTPGDTVMEVASILFESAISADLDTPLRPKFKSLDVYVGAVEQITGKRMPVRIELVDDEINRAANAVRNKGKVFARLIEKVDLSFSGAGMKTGGALSPDFAITAMREALPAFGRQIKGFDLHDAVMTGVETRTSSPVSIRRGEDFQSVNTRGLYPAGEGAGYAGGILSAGIDGIKVAEAVARQFIDPAVTAA